MIKLYVKTHNETNLMYFGRTISIDVDKYPGSGTYWKHHIRKHGNDVSTMIVFEGEDTPFLVDFALGFSAANNIVLDEGWANLAVENGKPGSGAMSEASKQKLRIARAKQVMKPWSEESKEKLRQTNLGHQISTETKEKIAQTTQKYYDNPDLMSDSQKSLFTKKKCNICGFVGSGGAMIQFHFDNCNLNPKNPKNKIGSSSKLYYKCPHCGFEKPPNYRNCAMSRYHFDNCKNLRKE